MPKPLNIAIIGSRFMGRAHSNAWSSVNKFFNLPMDVVMHSVCARDARQTSKFARKWGWANSTTNFKDIVNSHEIDLVDIATPNYVHAQQAIAALEASKHVACEKPLAGTLDDARKMRDAARKAKRKGIQTFVWFNYRRCPAVAFAHQLVQKGKLGRIYHVRAKYLQDWGGPQTPLSWRFDSKLAGSGAHGDLNAHIIDMARFITSDEIIEVSGAVKETFIKQRQLLTIKKTARKRFARSTVDDCVLFLAKFKSGAVGSFEATRLATGNQNLNQIEINGEKGAIRFDFERMNELQWWDNTLDSSLRGWSRIMCTNAGDHPYMDAYWPPAHLIGYEHGFISQAADIIRMLCGKKPIVPMPDFEDAYQTQRILHAALISAKQRQAVRMSEVK